MKKASNRPDVGALFTYGRHEHISVCIFTRASTFVTRHLIMIMQPMRNGTMGQPMRNVKFLKQAYQAATVDPFSHLFIDMRSDTPEIIRHRSNVLDEIQTVY